MGLVPRRLEHGEEATLVEHLGELRSRIVVSLLAIVVGFAVAYAFHKHLITWLEQPLPKAKRELTTFSPAEPFLTSFWVSLFASLVVTMPIVMWQGWAFLAPAFRRETQRQVAALVAFAAVLASIGIVFGYFIVLPAAVHFLTSYDASVYAIQIRAKDYLSFATTVLLAVAVVFEVPIFILGLVRIGVLTPQKLRKNWRAGTVIMCAIAVALPGVDPVTTTLEMVPMVLLYFGSMGLAHVLDKKWRPERYSAPVGASSS